MNSMLGHCGVFPPLERTYYQTDVLPGMPARLFLLDWFWDALPPSCVQTGKYSGGELFEAWLSANHWLSSIKINRLSWYLTLVSANQASNNSARVGDSKACCTGCDSYCKGVDNVEFIELFHCRMF